MAIAIRLIEDSDIALARTILNEIIRIGGITAFETEVSTPGVALRDGTPVDRISRRFDL